MFWRKWPALNSKNLPPLVLLHGGFGSWTHWIANIEYFACNRDVIVPDLPGLGSSATPPIPHTVEGLSKIISDGLGLVLAGRNNFHLVGFSFGGLLGSAVAVAQGACCKSFVAVGASGFGKLHNVIDGLILPGPNWTEEERRKAHLRNLELLMIKETKNIDELAVYCHDSNIHHARMKSRKMSLSDGFFQNLPNIRSRVGGIWGEFDSTAGGEKLISLRRDIIHRHDPSSLFQIISGAGHWVMYETPSIFNKTLNSMILHYESSL
ncbi:MAG: 2-succinyl-6-hydroxy-2,4-cyclohexadiene-1-carboxylate synthase [Alphaproteobacteria bacterium MarineAlpha3_Bin5]|nr:hypothetical protein [Magnetovibrio sp.]PPR77329.1 MAG: 2-succinyl-6-hydroxy-2,4-cyclohexadiene-1-carboxylate synthase [Alphaproteobacteria bacterium MarineAlpha3_Bin5]